MHDGNDMNLNLLSQESGKLKTGSITCTNHDGSL